MFKKSLIALFILTPIVAYASPYMGLSMGVNVNTSDEVGMFNASAANYRGIPLTLSGGYGIDLRGPFYIAGELFITPTTGELSSSRGNYLKTTYGYGLAFIPGVQLSEHTVGYARLGLVRTHYESQNADVNGAQFGLGLQTSVTQNWDVRGEYAVTAYDNFKEVSSLRSDQFNLGVVYRFF